MHHTTPAPACLRLPRMSGDSSVQRPRTRVRTRRLRVLKVYRSRKTRQLMGDGKAKTSGTDCFRAVGRHKGSLLGCCVGGHKDGHDDGASVLDGGGGGEGGLHGRDGDMQRLGTARGHPFQRRRPRACSLTRRGCVGERVGVGGAWGGKGVADNQDPADYGEHWWRRGEKQESVWEGLQQRAALAGGGGGEQDACLYIN